jgi:flagellar biosynthesis/type III secretory pathway protein FliH
LSKFVRVYGREVSVGEPMPIQADPHFRDDLESSLEILTQTRLMESEEQARNLLEDARLKAGKLLAEARTQAEAQARESVAQARREADGIREAAREEGFKAGFQEGYTDATTQVEQDTIGLLAGAQCLVEGAYLAEKRVLKSFEKHALALVEQVVHRILGECLPESPEAVLRLIERGVESLYLSGKVKVVVSAQVLQEIRAFSSASAEALATMSRFEFTADPLLDAHQIYVIGQDATFDFTPAHQACQLLAPLEKHLKLPREEACAPDTSEK